MKRLFSFTLLTVLLAGSAAQACTIPVFRYALDRWFPDNYRIQVPKDMEVDASLLGMANCEIIPEEKAEGIALLAPSFMGDVVLRDGLTPEELPGILRSKVRTEIAKRIVAGDSAVLLVVGDTKSKKFKEAQKRIDTIVKTLNKKMELPYIDPLDPSNRMGPGPELKVSFSVIAMDSKDAAEANLLLQLTAPNRGETPEEDESTDIQIYPVFGRGRALAMIPYKDDIDETLEQVAYFLLGPCSCQVKSLNPGWDLLIGFDWDDALSKAEKPADTE